MNFSEALEWLKTGSKLQREGWNGKGICIEVQQPDQHSKMTHRYLYIDTTGVQTDNPKASRIIGPWLPSQSDIFAEDWTLVEP